MLLSLWICLCFLYDLVCLKHLFALFVWLVLRVFRDRGRTQNACVSKWWEFGKWLFFEGGWLAEFLLSHYLVLPELSLDVLILISRVTGTQSRHAFIYSNMKYKFVMVNSLTSEMQRNVWQMRMLKPPKAEGVGARKWKTRTPWNLWQKLPRRTKQIQKVEHMRGRYVLEQTVVFWLTGWEDCADKDIFEFACLFITFAFS